MHLLTRQSAQSFLLQSLENKSTQKESEYAGFFYSEMERSYVVFDRKFNIEYKKDESECLKWLSNGII